MAVAQSSGQTSPVAGFYRNFEIAKKACFVVSQGVLPLFAG
jgi:hypothetical protein